VLNFTRRRTSFATPRDVCFGSSGKADVRGLDQPQPLEAGVAVLADDDVIVDRNAERLCHRDDLLRHLDVGMRRCRVAGWMIVHQDDRARCPDGGILQSALPRGGIRRPIDHCR